MTHLSKFSFKTQYWPGQDNANTDAVLQKPVEGPRGATDDKWEEVETPNFLSIPQTGQSAPVWEMDLKVGAWVEEPKE